MDRKMSGILCNVTNECCSNHCTDVDREGQSGLRQKPGEDGSESDRKDQLENCGCIHIGVTLMFLLILDQKTVILRDGSREKIFLLDKTLAERTAYQASCNQTEGCCCGTDRGGTAYIKVFQNRSESSCCTVSTDHGNRSGTHTDKRIDVQHLGKSYSDKVLRNDKYDNE